MSSQDAAPRGGVFIDGEERPGSGDLLTVTHPYDDSLVGTVQAAGADDVAAAVESAARTFQQVMRRLPAHDRARILRATARYLRGDVDALANAIVLEVGKPIRDARREAGRAADLFDLAADLVSTLEGEVLTMDAMKGGENRFGYTLRVPVGVVAALTPFNSPINLSVNKIAPALAAGNTVVLKPASKTPFSGLYLANALKEGGLPDGGLNVVIGSGERVGTPLVSDPRVRMVTFTGSVATGLAITRIAGVKKLALELGSSAANIVCADADVPAAAKALATSAYLSSGQACMAAQRLIVHTDVYEQFVEAFVAAAQAMKIGDPRDPATEIGPMVSVRDVERVLRWVDEARAGGAKVIAGGERVGNTIAPTLVANVPPEASLACEEAFAPVATIARFRTNEEAVALANDSQFGLQGGVFTTDLATAFFFAREFDVGGLWINDSSRYRQDNYPFGGMKMSGIGREGVRYAMEEMTELRFVGLKLGPSTGIL
jgi:acyl-CoA reductase-like NAD-dependent aldehyde dehydrogenase